jgi:hypothetical protein
MGLPSDRRGADLPMLGYAAILATVLGLFALGLYWLQKPHVIPNPGLAAYRPATAAPGPLAMSPETAMAMERSAQRAAGVLPVEREAKTPEQKAERTAQTTIRAVPPMASRPATDARRPQGLFGFAQNPFQSFGRWF